MAKVKVNISVNPDTAERLKQYSFENHMNVSQAIEHWIWNQAKVKCNQVRGQRNLEEVLHG